MTALAQTTMAYALLVAIACLVCAVRSGPRPTPVGLALGVAGVGAVGTAVVATVGLLTGPAPAEFGVHVGYLVTAPLLLPLSAALVRGDRGRWGSAVYAVGAVALAVVMIRLVATAR